MKKLLLFFILATSFTSLNGIAQETERSTSCSVTSNFRTQLINCNTIQFNPSASSNLDTSIVGYYWNFGDGTSSTAQNPTHSYTNNGTYTATLTIIGFNSTNGECCTDDFSRTITIQCGSPCGVSITSIQEVNALGQNNVAFYAVTQVNPGWNITSSTFEVTYANGTILAYAGSVNPATGYPQIVIPVLCLNKVMQVKVTVVVSNSSGVTCSDIDTRNWSPLGVCGTGDFFRVSPNPAKNTIHIELNEGVRDSKSTSEVVLYNLFGNVEQKYTIPSNQESISLDVSSSKPGIYILKFINDENVLQSQKVIIAD